MPAAIGSFSFAAIEQAIKKPVRAGAARDPKIHILFQIADMGSGVIRWVNADLVTHILPRDP